MRVDLVVAHCDEKTDSDAVLADLVFEVVGTGVLTSLPATPDTTVGLATLELSILSCSLCA